MSILARLNTATGVAGAALLLALPVSLLAGRGLSEVLIGLICGLFLLHSTLAREWGWLRRPVLLPALVWWGWMVFCSLPPVTGAPGAALVQALVLGRFFVLIAALSEWLLAEPAWRRAFVFTVSLVAVWIGLQCWQQYVLGVNLFGDRRWVDGALTGPFYHPVAGPALALTLFPTLMVVLDRIAPRGPHGWWQRAACLGVVLLAAVTMILIGQRMPVLLTALGLVCCGLLLRSLRGPVVVVLGLSAVVLASLPVISPPTFAKLVVHFADQMSHFWQSDYGLLYTRALVMTQAHPLLGLGFDGFRNHCAEAAYRHGIAALGNYALVGSSAASCNIHPHNHYLEAATAGGLPVLVLFCWMVWRWLRALAHGATRSRLRAGLFASVLIAVWPLASTSAFFTLPNAGWLFVLLGLGLAQPGVLRASRSAPVRQVAAPAAARLA